MPRRALALALLLALTGCAGRSSPRADPTPTPTGRDPNQVYRVGGVMLENAAHGPELCRSVLTSLPPQCGGTPVTPWSWDGVAGVERVGAVTWAHVSIYVTYDGTTFHAVSPPPSPPPPSHPSWPKPPMPCPEPSGGWVTTDWNRARPGNVDAVHAYGHDQPDFAGLWVSRPAGLDVSKTPMGQGILVVAFTGDLDRHERRLRELWGGPLCVTRLEHTYADLVRIQNELRTDKSDVLRYAGSGIDESHNVVHADVFVADRWTQAYVDAKWGAGAVTLEGWLQPVG